MWTLIKRCGWNVAMSREAGPMIIALAIAEFLYKFHSFLLESLAFLLTWFVVSALYSAALDRMRRRIS